MGKDKALEAVFSAYTEEDILDEVAPEKGLMLAVLSSAMSDLKKNGSAQRKATAFFLSDDQDEYLFSFQTICSYLSIDPRRVLLHLGLKEVK